MIRRVLVPLDGSELAEKALTMARRVLQPDGKIILLMAVQHPEPPAYDYPSAEAVDALASEKRIEEQAYPQATSYLEHTATNYKLHGYQVETEIIQGDPAVAIVERALVHGVEMIIMSTHERSGISRLLFGSVTLQILNDSPCPVLMVPDKEQVRVDDESPAADLGFSAVAAE